MPGTDSSTSGPVGGSRRSPPPADRWARQIRYAGIGADGQQRLLGATVAVVGVGALGSHAAASLTRAGIGSLHLVDRDVVAWNNLHRQVLFDEADARAAAPKARAARAHLRAIRHDATVHAWDDEFDADLWERLDPRPDVVIDGTDNFVTRYLINDLCDRDGVPWVHGGAVGSSGRALAIVPGRPCLRCFLPTAPPTGDGPTCETAGVVAPAIAQVAAFQVAQTLRMLVEGPDAAAHGMLVLDVWTGNYAVRFADARPRADCATCGTHEWPALTAGTGSAVALCGRNAVQVRPSRRADDLDLHALGHAVGDAATDVRVDDDVLGFRVDDVEFRVFASGRALLLGIDDPARAKGLYDRWIGVS